MAQPASRQELIDYSLRQLGAPVLEINVADEQIQDLMDDWLDKSLEVRGILQSRGSHLTTGASATPGTE